MVNRALSSDASVILDSFGVAVGLVRGWGNVLSMESARLDCIVRQTGQDLMHLVTHVYYAAEPQFEAPAILGVLHSFQEELSDPFNLFENDDLKKVLLGNIERVMARINSCMNGRSEEMRGRMNV